MDQDYTSNESVVFNGKTFRRYPNSKNRSDKVYFGRTENGTCKRLHVAIYEFYNGTIPDGYHIHHKDENPLNNNIENLVCVNGSSHISEHGKKRLSNIDNYNQQIIHLASINDLAKEWHKSTAGHEWHKNHPPKHVKSKYVCLQCKKEFETDKKCTNKFCSNSCKSAYRRDSGVDNVKRICLKCGKEFTANKYTDIKHCSKSCGKKK